MPMTKLSFNEHLVESQVTHQTTSTWLSAIDGSHASNVALQLRLMHVTSGMGRSRWRQHDRRLAMLRPVAPAGHTEPPVLVPP